jgi:hypothetical protein
VIRSKSACDAVASVSDWLRLIIGASCHYQPITAILYTSRTGTVVSVIQADNA